MRAARLDLYGEDPKQAAAEMKAHEEMVKQKMRRHAKSKAARRMLSMAMRWLAAEEHESLRRGLHGWQDHWATGLRKTASLQSRWDAMGAEPVGALFEIKVALETLHNGNPFGPTSVEAIRRDRSRLLGLAQQLFRAWRTIPIDWDRIMKPLGSPRGSPTMGGPGSPVTIDEATGIPGGGQDHSEGDAYARLRGSRGRLETAPRATQSRGEGAAEVGGTPTAPPKGSQPLGLEEDAWFQSAANAGWF